MGRGRSYADIRGVRRSPCGREEIMDFWLVFMKIVRKSTNFECLCKVESNTLTDRLELFKKEPPNKTSSEPDRQRHDSRQRTTACKGPPCCRVLRVPLILLGRRGACYSRIKKENSLAKQLTFRYHQGQERVSDRAYTGCTGVSERYCEAGQEVMVEPTPATHAILAQLKAGETVYQAGELPKTLSNTLRTT